MSAVFDFVSNNQLLSSLAATVLVALAVGGYRWYRDTKDSKAIYEFLLSSKKGTYFIFSSTEAIASATNLSESRVADLCSKHKKIKRNEKEKQSWRIVE